MQQSLCLLSAASYRNRSCVALMVVGVSFLSALALRKHWETCAAKCPSEKMSDSCFMFMNQEPLLMYKSTRRRP